jgi:hypothetical protein
LIELCPSPELSSVIQEDSVRALSALRMAVGVTVLIAKRQFFRRHSPPTRPERKELAKFAVESGLEGVFYVAVDRVFSGGYGGKTVMQTEFHLFRGQDVPYLMSLKTALEVMRT